MEKKHIIRFLKEKKRGIYTSIVNVYADVVDSMGVQMALEVIKEDLERESGVEVQLNYYSLAQAISRLRKKVGTRSGSVSEKRVFRNTCEMKDSQSKPGTFKVD